MSATRVGIIGLGNVGSGTLRLLHANAAEIERKLGFPLEVSAVCSRRVVRNPSAAVALHPGAFRTSNWRDLIARPDVDIVAELVGGTGVAREMIEAALTAGKPVVTANKELLAEQGAALWRLAREHRAGLGLEASVAGGIPINPAHSNARNYERSPVQRRFQGGRL